MSGRGHGHRPPLVRPTLPEELSKYYTEVGERFKSLEDPDERALLADNALAELGERALEVAGDPVCSRILESLSASASVSPLAAFLDACASEEGLAAVCTGGPFVSRVVERILTEVFARAERSGAAGDDDDASAEGAEDGGATTGADAASEATLASAAVARFGAAVTASLFDMITSRHGSFLARKLLSLAAGRDLGASATRAGPRRAAGGGAAVTGRGPAPGAGDAGRGGSRAAPSGGVEPPRPPPVRHPRIVDPLLAAVASPDWAEDVPALRVDAFAAPFLQQLLRATVGDEGRSSKLIRAVLGCAPSATSPDALHALMCDARGSHVAEALFEAAGEADHASLCTVALRGNASRLAAHAAANHAVQAAVAGLRRPPQLRRLLADLRPALLGLLRARRGGIALALLVAGRRLLPDDPEVPQAVASAAALLDPAGGCLEAVLVLDTNRTLPRGDSGASGAAASGEGARDGENGRRQGRGDGEGTPGASSATGGPSTATRGIPGSSIERVRLNPLGCSIAIEALGYAPLAAKPWTVAVGSLSKAALASVAADPGGARVLEAYLESVEGAPRKTKALLSGLKGAYAGVAAASGASLRFVERCFDLATPDTKRAIAEELAAARATLVTLHQGPALLRRCMVDELTKGGANDWQRKLQCAADTREEFAELFGEKRPRDDEGDDEDVPAAGAEKKSKKKAKGKTTGGTVEPEGAHAAPSDDIEPPTPAGETSGVDADAKRTKKEKRKEKKAKKTKMDV